VDRLACVDVPALPLQLLLRAHPDWRAHPVAVVDRDKPQGLVLWINESARGCGILPGQRYSEALALAAELRAAEVAPAEITACVDALTERLRTLTPDVEPCADEPGVFWLNAAGLGHLFPSLETWGRAICAELRAVELKARVVVGFRRFGVYAVAKARPRRAVVVFEQPDEEEAAMRRAPLDRVGLEPHARDALARLAVRTVGEFLALPPGGILRRFGARAHRLHRLGTGDAWAPLQPRPVEEPLARRLDLDEPDGDLESLLFLIKHELDPLLARLAERGEALAELTLTLVPPAYLRRAPREERLRPAEPTLDSAQLLGLVRLRLESARLDGGAQSIGVAAAGAPATREQLQLFAQRPRRDLRAAARAIARVRATLGAESVVRAQLRDGHLPEARFTWQPIDAVTPAKKREPARESENETVNVSASASENEIARTREDETASDERRAKDASGARRKTAASWRRLIASWRAINAHARAVRRMTLVSRRAAATANDEPPALNEERRMTIVSERAATANDEPPAMNEKRRMTIVSGRAADADDEPSTANDESRTIRMNEERRMTIVSGGVANASDELSTANDEPRTTRVNEERRMAIVSGRAADASDELSTANDEPRTIRVNEERRMMIVSGGAADASDELSTANDEPRTTRVNEERRMTIVSGGAAASANVEPSAMNGEPRITIGSERTTDANDEAPAMNEERRMTIVSGGVDADDERSAMNEERRMMIVSRGVDADDERSSMNEERRMTIVSGGVDADDEAPAMNEERRMTIVSGGVNADDEPPAMNEERRMTIVRGGAANASDERSSANDERPAPSGDRWALRPMVRRILARPRPLPDRPSREPDGWLIDGLAAGPVERTIGPYLISGGWWRSELARDYYFAELRAGAIYWVYYDRARRRWFLQGRVT